MVRFSIAFEDDHERSCGMVVGVRLTNTPPTAGGEGRVAGGGVRAAAGDAGDAAGDFDRLRVAALPPLASAAGRSLDPPATASARVPFEGAAESALVFARFLGGSSAGEAFLPPFPFDGAAEESAPGLAACARRLGESSVVEGADISSS
jgi:hypothetical protein